MMGLATICVIFELVALPVTGILYMIVMFPSRYTPVKSFLMQFPAVLMQLSSAFWMFSPNYMQARFLLGGIGVIMLAYSYYRVFTVPLRTSCAWYFAYCMVSPHTLVGTCYSIFSPYGDIMPNEVQNVQSLGRFLLKTAIIFAVSAAMIWGAKRLYTRIPLSRRSMQWIERCCNTFYIFFTVVWEVVFLYQNTLTLRHILPAIMLLGIVWLVILKFLFDAAEKRQLAQDHAALAQQCALQYRSFRDSLSHEQAIRRFRHDMMGHLQTMRALLERGQYARMAQYADQLVAQFRSNIRPPRGNHTLAGLVVSQYRAACDAAGIRLCCKMVNQRWPDVEDADFMCLLAALLDEQLAYSREPDPEQQPEILIEIADRTDGVAICGQSTVCLPSSAAQAASRYLADLTQHCGGTLTRTRQRTELLFRNCRPD